MYIVVLSEIVGLYKKRDMCSVSQLSLKFCLKLPLCRLHFATAFQATYWCRFSNTVRSSFWGTTAVATSGASPAEHNETSAFERAFIPQSGSCLFSKQLFSWVRNSGFAVMFFAIFCRTGGRVISLSGRSHRLADTRATLAGLQVLPIATIW